MLTNPTDSANALNVVATYTGDTVSGYALGNGASGDLGTFVLTSLASGITTTTIPAAVPEPASLALLGSALALTGAVRRRRKV